jgi:hypothetical protein
MRCVWLLKNPTPERGPPAGVMTLPSPPRCARSCQTEEKTIRQGGKAGGSQRAEQPVRRKEQTL